MSEKILVAVDFSKVGEAVARYGHKLGCSTKAAITFVHVVPEPSLVLYNYAPGIPGFLEEHQEELKKVAKKKMQVLLEHADAACGPTHADCKQVILEGDPAQTILDYAKEHGYTMLILGYKGHSAMERLLIGSTVNKIVAHAPCSVLVYRPPLGEEA